MRNYIRKFLCLVLCLATLTGIVLPAAAQAPKQGTYGAFSWTMDADTLTISGSRILTYSPQQSDDLRGNYKNLVIGEGITQLGCRALDACTSAKNLYLPVSVTKIDSFALPCWNVEGSNEILCIKDVYYAGTQAQWDQMYISDDCGLRYATIHCLAGERSNWYLWWGDWYYNQRGVNLTGWNVINGYTYYMDATGAMQTGWKNIQGNWYYFSATGTMQTGWKELQGKWYYFNTNGAMQTGWLKIGSSWYYLNEDGTMVCRDCLLDGQVHRFSQDGRWLGYATEGFYTQNGHTYFIKPDHTFFTGWKELQGKWYYFRKNGVMAQGWEKIGNSWYYLDPTSGVMKTGWLKINGNRYYLNPVTGAMKTGWLKENGKWYYLQDSGAAATGRLDLAGKSYLFDDSCALQTGWIEKPFQNRYGGELSNFFYANKDGELQTGWRKIDGSWYYFYNDGHMAVSTYIDHYHLDQNGVMDRYMEPETFVEYHYGSTAQQAAQADALCQQIAQDAIANGGDTDYEKVTYAIKELHKRYSTRTTTNSEMGVYESIYAPLFLGACGNHSDQLAIGRILDYMGISWYRGERQNLGYGMYRQDEWIYLKMDGEYGRLHIFNRYLTYCNESDMNVYIPTPTADSKVSGSWVKQQGKWYFYNTQGKKITGWLRTGNKQYYLGTDGAMVTGWAKISGSWYYFDTEGAMLTGIQTIAGKNYCFDVDGKLQTGWFASHRGNWFYADQNGVMAKGWKVIGGKYYYFYKDGHMAQETFIDNNYINVDGVWESTVALHPNHNHYKYLSSTQAAQADAVAKAIAEEAMANGGETDLEKVTYASMLVRQYVKQCQYGNDTTRYYRSPYGVFVAGVYTCAGSTRAMGRVLEFMGFEWYHIGEDQWSHQWVCVKMDGEYGWVEPQLGEAGYGNFRQSYIPN